MRVALWSVAMRAEILTIGDELCRGEIVDTNSSYLAGLLWERGVTTRWMTSCNDDADDLAQAVTLAVGRADVVVCSGGLGPTEDDLTVDVVAGLAGVAPEIDPAARARMEAWLARRSGPGAAPLSPALAAIQLRQVRIPAGARTYANPAGLAPGFEISLRGVPVICLPGFPREIRAIVDDSLADRLGALRDAAAPEHIARRTYRTFGRGESQISQACRGLIDGAPGTTIHYQVKFPETLVKLVVRDRAADAAAARLAALDQDLRARLAGALYGDGEETLIERAVRRMIAAGRTCATAESCTGGLIGELLTSRPGSSRAYAGGAIVYRDAEKVRQLGVLDATLAAHGAVSEATACEMAAGARRETGADYALAVTGIAGPGGGSDIKPVGTVFLGFASATETFAVKQFNAFDRETFKNVTATQALELLRRKILALD